MGLRDQYNFDNLTNAAEGLILDELERQLDETPKVCKCQDCVLDMAAFALNQVKPYYRVSLMGRLYADSAQSTAFGGELKKAVTAAIKKIIMNPSHD
jgi:competence protein ComFB